MTIQDSTPVRMRSRWETREKRLNELGFDTYMEYHLVSHGVVAAVGLVIVQTGGKFWDAVGTSLVAAAVAGWALFAYILVTDRWTRRLEVLTEFGFRDAFPARSVRIREVYDSRLQRARSNIDLLGFGQRAFREDYVHEFSAWIAHGARMRILLLSPEFPSSEQSIADQRDREEGNTIGSIRQDVAQFLHETGGLRSQHPDAFQVRLYDCLPTVNVFRIDDALFWGPYLVHDQSRNMPTFLVDRGGVLYDRLLGHFDDIWTDPVLSHDP